jgi:hypothetical protein
VKTVLGELPSSNFAMVQVQDTTLSSHEIRHG